MSANEAKDFFLKSKSYFDMDIPQYFNFNPMLEAVYEKVCKIDTKSIVGWKPNDFSDLNYQLLSNKDGAIAWRPFELINPVIYCKIVHEITREENWSLIRERFVKFNEGKVECCSIPVVSDSKNKTDQAEQILNWWKLIEQRSLEYSLEFSHTLITDVTNCYPSIYTHSISWAIHGKEVIKDPNNPKNKFDFKFLGNQIDSLIRNSREGQTNGIPQASLLSHFIAEIVLGYIDQEINKKISTDSKVKILRYRDDYRIFGHSDAQCNKILKSISEVLNQFGMRLGASKTSASTNLVNAAIKPDKILALRANLLKNSVGRTTLQKSLIVLHDFTLKNPNSGSIKRLLKVFLIELDDSIKNKRFRNENKLVLIAILSDIAFVSPNVFPAVATALSRILENISAKDRMVFFEKVHEKMKRIPNNGYLELWLQRIAEPNDLDFSSEEALCRVVNDQDVPIWNFSWIQNKSLRKLAEGFSIIDGGKIIELPTAIEDSEFDAFWNPYPG